jgi:hypothetical protein
MANNVFFPFESSKQAQATGPRLTMCRTTGWASSNPVNGTLPAAARDWKACSPPDSNRAPPFTRLSVSHLQLTFSVSRDEEHVHLRVRCGSSTFDMGARAHNFLLLTLARRRLQDAADGFAETTCGWIYQEDLEHDPTMAPPGLNTSVFRVRRQFAVTGVADAANIIERRAGSRQMRIGTGRIAIVSL